MVFTTNQIRFAPRLVDALYTEAMLLADEARAYFGMSGAADREALPPLLRVTYSCEALRISARLMHIVAWLLTRRAVESGETQLRVAEEPLPRLGRAEESDPAKYAMLPESARALIDASRELYQRVERLDGEMDSAQAPPSPVRGMLNRLERAF